MSKANVISAMKRITNAKSESEISAVEESISRLFEFDELSHDEFFSLSEFLCNRRDSLSNNKQKETKIESTKDFGETLRLKDAAAYLGIARPTLWRLQKSDPSFPKVTRITSRCCVYSKSDLDKYLADKKNKA